jgi:hypothetical protein
MRPSDDLDDDEREYACEYDDEDRDYCEHEEYEIDVLTGRAECDYCGVSWWATTEQIEAEQNRMAQYSEWAAEQDAIERRRERWVWVHRLWLKAVDALWLRTRKPRHLLTDDEIPF